MSKKIPNDRRLTDEERAYLLMRGEDARVKGQDERFPQDAEADAEGEGEGLDDEEGDNYDEWTYAELVAEVKKRKDEGAEIVPASQKQADLITALRQDDAAAED